MRVITGLIAIALCALTLALPASAGAVGELTYDGCLSATGSGGQCTDIPGDGAPLNGASDVAVSPDGDSVYVASGEANTISHFFAAPAGQLFWDGCVSGNGSGGWCTDIPGTGDVINGATGVAVSPNGSSVYLASVVSSTISRFFAAPQGQIVWDACLSGRTDMAAFCTEIPGSGDQMSSAADVAVSPDGDSVYVAALSSTISHFFADLAGQLFWGGCISGTGTGGLCTDVPGEGDVTNFAAGVAVSPNSGAVYLASPGSDNVAHLFASPTGQLFWDGCVSGTGSAGWCTDVPGNGDVLNGARSVAVSPDGNSVYVASQEADSVSHFFAQPQGQIIWGGCVGGTGSAGWCTNIPGSGQPLNGAFSVAVSPDGRSVYVAAREANAISHFSAAPQGQITFQGCYGNDGSNGCVDLPGNPLTGVSSVTVSADGDSIYAASAVSATATHFFRVRGTASGGGPGGGGPGGGGPGGGGGGGGGGPVPSCGGKRATIIGTPGNDSIRGTGRGDVIVGLAGNDKVNGLGGNDRVCGGKGNDKLTGGKGDDRLEGGDGNDKLAGEQGKDGLTGGNGKDTLTGGKGRDSCNGGSGKDAGNCERVKSA